MRRQRANSVACSKKDLNAKVGNNNKDIEHIMGKQGVGDMNESGEVVVEVTTFV